LALAVAASETIPMQHEPRRQSPRIEVAALCWEVVGERELSSLVVDLSSDGARLERPYVGGRLARELPLQLEVPGIDEVMWARAEVMYDQLIPARAPIGSPFGLLRRTGLRLAVAATRDLRLLREFVYDTARTGGGSDVADQADQPDLAFASCYLRG
jgi:hypothetical protein